ncbi:MULTISPECIES: SOUL family heme-binding protein [unclassified Sphingomonas]|uniref:SOUL family heme-binding protein n=1 Tax=unclassified Sphingomonas TaxID=196159 RepID=UPI00082C1473|nr:MULTISPECIES: heme-binding protein [unclassified Sphingomonas]
MSKTAQWAKIGGGIAALAVGAGAWFVWREKSVEQPDFTLVEQDGDFEIRDYPEITVAETVAAGARREATNAGFRRLADYIFAKDRAGEKIAMTAPVLQDQDGGTAWRTRFVMPAARSRATLPTPDRNVALTTLPPRRVAAVQFSGNADAMALETHERALREWLTGRDILPTGPVEYAFYNSPFVPGPLKRNEILLPIAG